MTLRPPMPMMAAPFSAARTRRDERERQRRRVQLLIGVEHFGLETGPAREEIVGAAGFEGFDDLQTADRRARELAAILLQAAIGIHAFARDIAQGGDVEERHADADSVRVTLYCSISAA